MSNVELFELCDTKSQNAMQRMPSLLESRHRLLHLRASLERKWSQPRRHSMDIGPSLNSKLCHWEKDDLMAIDMGLKNKEIIILPVIWDRDTSRGILKGFTIVSWKIPNFVNLNSNMIELRKSVSRWTRTRRKISPIVCRKTSTLDTERFGGSLSINLEKSDRWEILLTSTMRWSL